MKHGLFAFCLLALPHVSGTLLAQPVLSSREITNVNATADVMVNATLPLAPPTFNLTGPVTGTAAFFFGVTATTTDGLSSFSGSIDPISSNYMVKVPAGTYQLSVSYLASLSGATGLSTYYDPAQVRVNADTVHPINVVAGVTHKVSGLLSGLDARFSTTILVFSSLVANAGSSANIAMLNGDGSYTGSLPDGSYAALLVSATKDTSRVTSINLGNVTVAGADVTANFMAPGLSSLSGVVSASDGTQIQTGSSVIAFDGNLQSLLLNASITNFPIFSFGSGTIDPAAGAYQLLLPTGRQYTLAIGLSLLAMTATQSAGTFELVLPNTTQLQGDTTQNITLPAFPGTVNITGQVVDPSGAPVVGASVSASAGQVSGLAANTAFFSRSTQTDTSGNYRLTVLNGSNYDMLFMPPITGSLSGFSKAPHVIPSLDKVLFPLQR